MNLVEVNRLRAREMQAYGLRRRAERRGETQSMSLTRTLDFEHGAGPDSRRGLEALDVARAKDAAPKRGKCKRAMDARKLRELSQLARLKDEPPADLSDDTRKAVLRHNAGLSHAQDALESPLVFFEHCAAQGLRGA